MTRRKPNLLVKLSGNLLSNPQVFEYLRVRCREYAVVLCTGGGEQINTAFKREGFPIRFGPFGRVTRSLDERQLARDELERNQAEVQDLLAEHEIPVTAVIVPVLNEEIGTVICHVNGDLYPVLAFNGYDRIEVCTLESRRAQKEAFYRDIWDLFVKHGGKGIDSTVTNKIEVVGFPG